MRSGEREVDASAGQGGASDGGVRGSERGCVHDKCGSTGLAPDRASRGSAGMKLGCH
jgi:hypothetical protein